MKDLSRVKVELLNNYIEEFHPSLQEIDAFMRGMVWLQDNMEMDEKNDKLNNYIPEMSQFVYLSRDNERLNKALELLQVEKDALKKENRQFLEKMNLDKEERKSIKIEAEYRRLNGLINLLTNELSKLRKDYDKLLTKSLTNS